MSRKTRDQLADQYNAPAVTPPVGERHEDYFPPTKSSERRSPWLRIGIGAATVAAAVGGYFATTGGEKATESKQEPAASAPANPSEQAPQTPESLIGTPIADNINTLNMKPEQSVINDALEGAPVDQYKTPEEAFNRLVDILNVTELSATMNYQNIAEQETPESFALKNDLRDKLYSKEILAMDGLKDEDKVRKALGYELYFVNESEAAAPQKATWRRSYSFNTVRKVGDKHIVNSTAGLHTNIDTVDIYYADNQILGDLDEARQETQVSIELLQEDGNWVFGAHEPID